MAAIKALQQWCKNQCDGYKDVAVSNMTTSFRDGLAFCALIHKYRPDLINYESLKKDDVYENNKLAFRVAEEHLGIPALLDAEDMVALSIPDRLSILTYVSQYYNYFNGRSPIGGVGGVKRPAEGSKEEPSEKKNLPVVAKAFSPKKATENCPSAPQSQKPSPPPKPETTAEQKPVLVESSNKTGTLNSKCAVCKTHVHLVQRHLVDGKLYHRSCLKCSECSNPLLAGAYKAGPEPGTFICNAHQNGFKSSLLRPAQKTTPAPVKPSRPAASVVEAQVSKNDSSAQPATRPAMSVLTTPVKVTPRPVEPSPAPQPWTPSAQKTQAARQRFFQSSTPTPSLCPAPSPSLCPAPSSSLCPAPSSSPCPAPSPSPSLSSAPAAKEPVTTHGSAPGPAEAGTGLTRTQPKPEEKERARALISRKLAEGNCNNNNIKAHQSGLRADANRSGKGLRSAELPSWRLEKRSQGMVGGGAAAPRLLLRTTTTTSTTATTTASPIILTNPTPAPISTPTPTPVISLSSTTATTTTTSTTSSKESLWLAAIRERERARAPPTPLAIVNATTTTSSSSFSSSSLSAVFASGAKVKHMAASEGSADWRSKLHPSANGPGLKTPEPSKVLPLKPVEDKPAMTYKASLCITVNSTSPVLAMVQPSTSPLSSGSTSYRQPSVQQPSRKSSGASDDKKASAEFAHASSVPTPSVYNSFSATSPSSIKAPSPKQCRRWSAGFGSQNESLYTNGSSCQTPSVSSSVPPHRASSPKQSRRGSAGPGIPRDGYSKSTAPTPRWITPVTVSVFPYEPTDCKAPSLKNTPSRLPVQQGSTNGHYLIEESVSVAKMRSPAKENHIPMDEIVKELREIEENVSELEREGVDLEKRLRSCEEEGRGDILMDPLMVDWFNLIRKKQGYMRRESELVYLAKTQDLEEQQPGVEGELRGLLDKPEHLKSEWERRRQAELMERLLEIINDRNAIVEGLDQDRLREEEEDQQLNEMMQKLGMRKMKSKRQSSFSKLFRRKSKRLVAEG